MSDSLNATVIVIELALTISAKAELELDELELPRLPALELPPVAPVPPAELEPEPDEELLEALVVEPPDTVSPGEALDSDTTVPLVGAYSFVFATAISAVCTFASAL